jgi:DnaJ-class molecular chaperone
MAVPAPDGPAQVSVLAGTQPGAVLRIAAKCLPRYRGHGRGRLNVTIIVDIPRQLSPQQRQLYELLRTGGATGLGDEDIPGRT